MLRGRPELALQRPPEPHASRSPRIGASALPQAPCFAVGRRQRFNRRHRFHLTRPVVRWPGIRNDYRPIVIRTPPVDWL
ncbi:hypothetical protein DI458_28385 [Burkholderia contaminans]|nr:hypothetical protein [Burkholderia contaminans]MBA9839811.1 hypothetical protein [Burkholderia contaminans]MBA9865922.1 hypothetical protein [Burkholderia contaminans]MBA9907565.1 hypothetical protein [Burkholderia contaminans]MBA9932241.1 hypothetical protein [Burkholderia contaminans]